MFTRGPGYQAYVLRLWPARSGGQTTWRAMLEDVRTGERRGFGSLEELFAFLAAQTDAASTAGAGNRDFPAEPDPRTRE